MNNKKTILKRTFWTFFNHGAPPFRFDPNQRKPYYNGEQESLGAIHKELARQANSPSVFILNEHGEEVIL